MASLLQDFDTIIPDIGQFHYLQWSIAWTIDTLTKPSILTLMRYNLIVECIASKIRAANDIEIIIVVFGKQLIVIESAVAL